MSRQNNKGKYIADSQITASSELLQFFGPSQGRLDLSPSVSGVGGGWCAGDKDPDPYIQVDLLRIHTITKLATQGIETYTSWVTQFSVQYSIDGVRWYDYKESGKVRVFTGNRNTALHKIATFTTPITARIIRIKPLRANNDYKCLRMELYGCEPIEDCDTPVGLEDGRIENNQISASSHWNEHVASNARLNNRMHTDNNTGKVVWGGWCTDKKNIHQYLEVDLGHVRAVSGIATQGYQLNNFVKQYKMNYSIDGREWKSYKANGASMIFAANWDNETVIKNPLIRIFARFIRLNPVSWDVFGYVCMRVEIYECLPTKGSVPQVSPPGASYKVNRTSPLNVTCLLSGQEGFDYTWMRNGIPVVNSNTQTIYRQIFSNGTTLSTLRLQYIKYQDSGSVISCTAWYPGLAINTSRNVHVFVNAPRPVIKVSEHKARAISMGIIDPVPQDTAKYLVRYRIKDLENAPWSTTQFTRPRIKSSSIAYITLDKLIPFTTYVTEISSAYKDGDSGPYSIPVTFTTQEDVPSGPPRDVLVEPVSDGHIIVSWSVPGFDQQNGRIMKYEVTYRSKTKKPKSLFTQQLQKDIIGLEKDQRYEITVRAYTRVGPGPYSKYVIYSTETGLKPKTKTTMALEKLSKVTVTEYNAAKVTATVQNLTSKQTELQEQDIHMTANILNKVISTNSSSEKVGDNLLKTLSNVMDVDSEVLYKTQAKYNTSATLVKVLETYIEKGGRFTVDTDNIVVRRQQIKNSFKVLRTSVTTQNNKLYLNSTTEVTSGSEPKGSDASIIIPSSVFPKDETNNETVYFVYYKSSKLFAPNYQRIEVCRDGFTSSKLGKTESRGSTYTVERVASRGLVTESSPVISASLKGREVANLTEPVIIMFKLPPEMIEANQTKCVWWDFTAKNGRGGWSTEGCELQGVLNDTVMCECNHMTNFAALVDVYGPSSKPCGVHEIALSMIAYIGCGLSILGLCLTILTYGFCAKLRKDIAAKILLHLCIALLSVLIVFVAGIEKGVTSKLSCQIVAVLIHYFLLVAFMWFFFEAYFMYYAFVKVWNDHGDYILWKCASIAWGLPAVAVIVTIVVDKESYGGQHYCRLKDLPFFLAFLAPVVSIIFFNTIIFGIIMYKLSVRPPARSADKDRGREGILQLRRAFGILILVGLTWMFGFFAISSMRLVFTYLFAVLNCLQGFSIFMFYCVTQKNVRDCWRALLRCDLQSLNKKTMYTESYDPKTKTHLDTMRPRAKTEPAKGNTLQKDKLRPRMNTADVKLPIRDVYKPSEMSSDNPNYVNSEEDESAVKLLTHVTVTIEPPRDYQNALGSQCIDLDQSHEEIELMSRPESRSGSIRSHDTSRSRDPSKHGSRGTINSNQSTPKLFRIPRFNGGNSIGALSVENKSPVKINLKRTASHAPEAPKMYTPMCLRRTKSASSLGKDNRFSGKSLISFSSTSSESLSTDSQSAPRRSRLLRISDLDPDKYGELIISPQRGSVRGIVGHVETSVDTYDDIIEHEKKRSISLPPGAYSLHSSAQ
ncbi:adhesion G protein-coupled receptor L3-like isoform X2 [Actinia tenebrosa]|nr:adhesion G protein-coupled receptor L3-like isoform X2 [Actinia tenebrosa]